MTQDSRSNLTEQRPFAQNSAGSLAERLKARTQGEAIAIQTQTERELALHQQKLNELSAAALDTTGAAIARHTNAVKARLLGSENEIHGALSDTAVQINIQAESIMQTLDITNKSVKIVLDRTTSDLSEQQKDLREAIQSQTKWMLWLMKLPLLGLLAVCLAIFVGTLAWAQYQWKQANDAKQELSQTLVAQHQAESTLAEMGTWGIELQEQKDGRYIVLPKGTTADKLTYSVGKLYAIKLLKN